MDKSMIDLRDLRATLSKMIDEDRENEARSIIADVYADRAIAASDRGESDRWSHLDRINRILRAI